MNSFIMYHIDAEIAHSQTFISIHEYYIVVRCTLKNNGSTNIVYMLLAD
jgi:hypothetical protein